MSTTLLFFILLHLMVACKADSDSTDNYDNNSATNSPKVGKYESQNLFRSGSAGGRAGGCGSRFLPGAMVQNITDYCLDLIGFRMENFPPRAEDLVKINYDDKCFSKCYLTEMKFINSADNFNITAIMEESKTETPREKWPARLSSTTKCVKHTQDMAREEGGVSNSICKYALVFFVCQREEERKMVC